MKKNELSENATPSAATLKSAVDIHCQTPECTPDCTPGAAAQKKLAELRDVLVNIPTEVVNTYTGVLGLRLLITEIEGSFLRAVAGTVTLGADPFHVENARNHMLGIARASGSELAGAKALLAVLEASHDWKTGLEMVPPALAAIAEQEKSIVEARLHHEHCKHELARRKAAAVDAAEIENHPDVVAARKMLEAAVLHVV